MMNSTLQPGCFWGTTLKKCEVGDFILSETLYKPGVKISEHSHSQSFFCVVLQGSYRESYDSRSRECKPAMILFHPSGETHSDHFCDRGGRLFNLEMKQQWLDRIRERTKELNGSADFSGGTIGGLAFRLYKEFYQMDRISPLVIEGLGLEIVGEATRTCVTMRSGKFPRWLIRAKEFLHECFAEEVSLGKVANLAGVHPVHLARVFRRTFGCTIGEYLRRLRIEFALRQLSTTDTPLVEISMAAGFSDQSHFSKSFKLSTGMTPAQYRLLFR